MASHGPQVFISYHRADLPVAERVRAHLLTNQVKTWMDHYDIPAGAYWPDEIDQGLNESDLVVGLLSPDSVASRNVKNEWDWAIQNDKQLVLLMTRPCVIPHRYVSINFIDATRGGLSEALDQVLRIPELRASPALEAPRTRYARSGDVNIAYQVYGDGPADLVFVPGYVSHVEHVWKLPAVAAFLWRLATFARVMIFDKRGTGMSDRTGRISTLEERMDDIRAVMDACHSERAVVMGISEGVALSILFAATFPQRTRSIILYSGRASYVQQPDYPWMKPIEEQRQAIDAAASTLYETWGTLESSRESIRLRAPGAADDETLVWWFAELQRLGASPGAEIARQRMNLEIDVRHVLPAIRVPTLVVSRVDDRSLNIDEARYIAARIPNAELAELPGDAHLPHEGDQDALFAVIEQFVARSADRDLKAVPETMLATIVHIDCSDAESIDLAALAARESGRYKGRIAADGGAGIAAIFDGPARAIRFASAVSAALAQSRAEARAGIHVGEIEIGAGGALGFPAEIARRLAQIAGPGEVLTSGTVRDLVAGSGIRFAPVPSDRFGELSDLAQVLVVDRASLV